jgi:hypothetical protein
LTVAIVLWAICYPVLSLLAGELDEYFTGA